jgi:XTP/dITP diphosphohydrolase
MKELIFATNNPNKVNEVQSILNSEFSILSLEAAKIYIDIPEPHNTLEKNATEKSVTIFKLTKKDCFSEDTGLEVVVLNNEPGVKSARYAADDPTFQNNIDKLLFHLKHHENRAAQFRTVISCILNGHEYQFEGLCKGTITQKPRGTNGFGYDSIFIPENSEKTFAEMDLSEKNFFSHRKKAFTQLIDFLKSQHG